VTGIVKVELEAFDVRVTFPLAAPLAAGVNVTLKVAVCPAFRVRGAVMPLRAKPVPLIPTWEIVTLVPPLLVRASDRELLVPTVTLEKLRLLGFGTKVPGATPVPDSAMLRVGFDPSERIVTVPLALPLDCGAKDTVNVVL